MAEQMTTARLYATADTHVYGGSNSNSHDAAYTSFGKNSSSQAYGFFKFAAHGIHAGAKIVSAKMHVYLRYKTKDGAFTYTVRPASGGWSETGLRGNAMPTSTGVSNTVSLNWGIVTLDITDVFRAQYNGEFDYSNGIYITSGTANSYCNIFSHTNSDTEKRPWLVVTYEFPSSTPDPDKTTYTLGETVNVAIDKAEDGNTHTVRYKLNGTTIATHTGIDDADSLSLPRSLAERIPTATSAALTIEVDTYLDSELQGTESVDVTVNVPSDIVPVIAGIDVSEGASNWPDALAGTFVQGKSKFAITVDSVGDYGSTITGCTTTILGATYNGLTFTTGAVNGSGDITIAVVVTDSRGRKATQTETVTVLAYASPAVTAFGIVRMLDDGTVDKSGTYAGLTLKASVSSINGLNTIKAVPHYRPVGAGIWYDADAYELPDSSIDMSLIALSSDGMDIDDFDDLTGYQFRVDVSDLFETVTVYDEMPTKQIVWDVAPDGTGFAFGTDAESGSLKSAWPIVAQAGSTGIIDLVHDSGRNSKSFTNNSEKTYELYNVTEAGLYLIIGIAQFPTGTSGSYRFGAIKYTRSGADSELTAQTCPPQSSAGPRISMIGVLAAQAGDVIKLNINQNSGSTVTGAARLQILKIGGSNLT